MANVDINISAKDNTKAGFDSAIANAQKAQQAFNGLGEIPGMKTAQTNSAVLAQRIDNAATRAARLKAELVAISQPSLMSRLNSGMSVFAMTAVRSAAAVTAVGFAIKKTFDFSKQGAEIEWTAKKFDRLSASIGTTGDVMLRDLRQATRGTVSDMQLMSQGASLVQLGLAKTREEAIRLARVQTALGMDTGQLVLSIANQSKMRLDQLGISLVRFNQIKEQLRATGLSGQALYKETFLQTAEETVKLTGNQADSPLGNYQRMQASIENTVNAAKINLANSPLISGLVSDASNIMMAANAVQRQDMAWTGNILELLLSNGPVLKQGQASDFSSLWAGGAKTDQSARGFGRNAAPTQIGLSAVQNYTAMAYAARYAGGAGLQEGEGAEVDYEMLLDGALKITKQTEKYREVTASLNDQLMEQTILLQQTAEKYGVNSEKAKEAYTALQETQNQLKEARAAQAATGAGYVMANMAGMGADPQVMLDFALAAGMVTQEAHATQTAYLQVADAITTGTQSAQMGAQLANNIAGALTRLDGERFTTYVDVIVNWIGGAKIFGGATGLNQANQAAVHNCFAAGTMILMADGSTKPIEEVQAGDMVTSYDVVNKSLISAPVAEVFHHAAEEMGEYYLIINGRILVTPNHPLFVNGDWQEAGTIRHGDMLKSVDGEEEVILISRLYHRIKTYNLHIDDENHNYFADGILAHNKAGGGWISAPGDGTRDTIMMPLANQEFVVNAQEARKHADVLEAINEGKFIMGLGMASGGVVKSARASRGGFKRGSTLTPGGGGASGAFGGGGIAAADAAEVIMPEIADTVSGSVSEALSSSAQLQALSDSVVELKAVNDTLVAILQKTASAGDIGRAVNGDAARQA